MRKLYDHRVLIKVDGWDRFMDTSIWSHLRYDDGDTEPINEVLRYETFEELAEEIKKGWIYNAEIDETLFTHRPIIEMNTDDLYFRVNMTEKNFKPVEIKIVHDSASNKSLKTLYEHLTATEFCNFLKDNEIPYTKF